ncbi:SH3 domain-binding protein [Apis cerana cerana]|uniref:SH3 domain-binding protein n=1 Tax=Apis cerana cerana TaxID=94128 RepID=A0A2A3EGM6_APICC|nr:SH3 domain-binding protein [Apis cerana cerana]
MNIELENLNDATDDINKLETELDEAHTAFRQLLSETTKRLKEILNKVGNSYVEKARCYYEALEIARQAQIKCQQQAQLFQRASEIHAAAKETVALAESRFMSHQHEWNFDQAWQDMLNHATLKVMDAENQKAECGREHYRRAVLFNDAEKKLLQLEEKHHRSIIKARPYFEVKAQCDQMLATQKERVECLQKAIQDAKSNYATSLRRLEEISNQIHQQRQDYDFIANGPREPGVGAELVSPQKISNYDIEFNQSNSNRTKDIMNNQMKYNRMQDYDNSCQLQEDTEYLGKRSVDGSEAISSQWELELEANLENLNNLSLENSVLDHDKKLNYKFSQDKNHSIQNLKQSKNLFKTLKNPFVNKSLMTYFEESNSKSKSLNNSPMKINIFNLSSKFMEKNIHQRIAKYVPNNVFNFGFSNNKSQSNSDLNLSSNLNTSFIEKYQSFDNIIDDKTENFKDNVTNLKSNSIQFLPSNVNSSPIKSAVYLPNEQSLNRNLSCSSKYSISKLSEKQLIINELPLLSLFKKDNLLVNKMLPNLKDSSFSNFIS